MSIPEPSARARAREAARGAHRRAVPSTPRARAETSAGAQWDVGSHEGRHGQCNRTCGQPGSAGGRARKPPGKFASERAYRLVSERASLRTIDRAGKRASKPARVVLPSPHASLSRTRPHPRPRPAWPALPPRWGFAGCIDGRAPAGTPRPRPLTRRHAQHV
eukprot:363109-Chlamydomonas_euryale.AAC.2